ncbi:MAG: heavy-metal-associated domain-containing protein [Clostridia bacterium]|nr:heavy-metal-associated domain-containing protein [Clostridia bacterium]
MLSYGIAFVLVLVIAGAAWRTRQKFRKGGGCCGGREEMVARTAVTDRNKRHYPYAAVLTIGGMTCENCARRVENALNAMDGVWAAVRIDDHSAKVRGKGTLDELALRRAVRESGYVVTAYTEIHAEG